MSVRTRVPFVRMTATTQRSLFPDGAILVNKNHLQSGDHAAATS